MVVRVALANVDVKALAVSGQLAGLQGTISPAYGFGAWGVEPTVIVESTDDVSKVEAWITDLLKQHSEQAAYLTYDGMRPTLLYADGVKVSA